jgi:hypothetical protein
MFSNTLVRRTARSVRFLAVAALLAGAAVPAALSIGVDGPAFAQSSRGGGGGGGGSGGSDGGGNGPNSVLRCLGPSCINVSQAQIPPCTHGNCRRPEVEIKRTDSCEVQVCDTAYGEKICWIERAYDLRKCRETKNRL